MRKQFIFFILLYSTLLASCGPNKNVEKNIPEESFIKIDTVFVRFNSTEHFNDDSTQFLLSALRLCNKISIPCDARLFSVYPSHSQSINDGFFVSLRANVVSQSARMLYFINSNGEYIEKNHFLGELLELRKQPEGHYIPIIRHTDSSIGTVTVSYEWQQDQQHYTPKNVVEINDHFIKEELTDSLNKIYIHQFPWGF